MSAVREVLYGEFRRVSHVYRYSALPVLNRENVAEHSWWTAVIAMTIACEIGEPGMMGEVAAKAVLHDIEEIGTGDLVREAKYFDAQMREDFRRVEVAFANRLFDRLGTKTGDQLWHQWSHAKDDTLAGEIVALADLLCVVAYCRHEETMGNLNLRGVESECIKLIDQKFGDHKVLLPIVAEAVKI